MPPLTPEELFDAALSKVESKSIREWASLPKHRAAFLWHIRENRARLNGPDAADRVALTIVSHAIGL